MNFTALQATLRQFAADRHWQPFQTPKNLAMALMVEAAELAEIFQWLTPEQSQAAHQDAVTREHIGQEIADVLIYLVQIADHCQIDLPQAVADKLVLNAHESTLGRSRVDCSPSGGPSPHRVSACALTSGWRGLTGLQASRRRRAFCRRLGGALKYPPAGVAATAGAPPLALGKLGAPAKG